MKCAPLPRSPVLGPVAEPPALFAPAATESTSQGEQYLQRQVDPFFLLPLVSVIPPAEHFSDFAPTPQPSTASDASASRAVDECFLLDYRFVDAARFPLPISGFHGECLEDPGAVVYEGMRLAIRPDGRYQVRFTVGTPAMPVTMQLQFDCRRCTGGRTP